MDPKNNFSFHMQGNVSLDTCSFSCTRVISSLEEWWSQDNQWGNDKWFKEFKPVAFILQSYRSINRTWSNLIWVWTFSRFWDLQDVAKRAKLKTAVQNNQHWFREKSMFIFYFTKCTPPGWLNLWINWRWIKKYLNFSCIIETK